jgi:hypothetical protein
MEDDELENIRLEDKDKMMRWTRKMCGHLEGPLRAFQSTIAGIIKRTLRAFFEAPIAGIYGVLRAY